MVNRLLARLPVMPFYNQVMIGDHKETAVPEWDSTTRGSGVSASETSLLVSTCNDQDGHVIVDVRAGNIAGEYGRLVFDGTLRIDSQTLAIGSVTSEPSRGLYFPRPGEWQVKVYVNPSTEARHVTVLIPDYNDPDMPDEPWMSA